MSDIGMCYDKAKALSWETLPKLENDIKQAVKLRETQLEALREKRITPDDDRAVKALRRSLKMLTEALSYLEQAQGAIAEVKDCLSWDPDLTPFGESDDIDDLLSPDHE